MHLDLDRWAVVAHNDDTGFGRQARDVRAVLGLGWHLVVPSKRLEDKLLRGERERWLRPDAPTETLRELLEPLQGIIFFETHGWHPELLPTARALGVKSVCVPNWEWFDGRAPAWKLCDLFACPTEHTVGIVRDLHGFRNARHLPPTLDLARFPARMVRGPARTFLHNAGLVDGDDRKGTGDTIRAFAKMLRARGKPDADGGPRLRVRLQKPAPLPAAEDSRITVEVGNLPDETALYAEGDAAIQPSKMEGIGFMVLEAVCSGLPTITTDAPPMNEFVRQPELRARARWFKRRAFATTWVPHAHLRLPHPGDLAAKIRWCAEHDLSVISADNRRWAEETFAPERLRAVWSATLRDLLAGGI